MKTVKRLFKCTNCSSGPCFSIVPDEEIPEYCSIHDYTDYDADEEAEVLVSVNWYQLGLIISHEKEIDPYLIKEILDA